MSPTGHSEVQDFSGVNNHIPKDNQLSDSKDSKKLVVSKKVFVHRNSVLTDLMQVSHLQSLYNITVAVCFLLFLNAIIFYLAEPSILWEDLSVLKFGFSKFSYFIKFWLVFNSIAFGFYEGFKLWIAVRNRIHTKVADGLFLLAYVTSFFVSIFVAASYMLKVAFPPVTGFAIGCEQMRIYMKIHSYVRENIPRVKQYQPQKDGNQQRALYPTRQYYLYYLFAPVLIYRDSYPTTEKRQWRNVFYNLYKFFLVIFIAYCVYMRFNVDSFKNTGLKPFTRKEAAFILCGTMASGTLFMFLIFYGILHCWFNATAELLRFGDKEFYQDWWNSTTFTQYYRRWNVVVHDWLHAYIYTDTQRLGFSRSVSMILVFFLSAVFHEYVITLAFGYFYPVLLAVYTTIGISVIFITKSKTTQYWNTFMFGMLFSGWGVLIYLYTVEWYARINCPKEETISDFFTPRTWDPSCHIINFS